MGLKCNSSINYSISSCFDWKCLLCIAKLRSHWRASSLRDTCPIINFDASWVILPCSFLPLVRIDHLMSIFMLFVKNGCCKYCLWWGDLVSYKRSTTKRTTEFHRQFVYYRYAKCKLSSLSGDLNTKYLSSNNRKELLKEK